MPRVRPLIIVAKDRQVVIPATAFEWQFARSAGPGGQHVNRTSSKAILRFDATGCPHLPTDIRRRLLTSVRARLTGDGALVLMSQRHREQGRNVADCLEKLSRLIEKAMVPPEPRRPTRIPRAARAARLESKKRRASTKRLRRVFEE